MRYYYPEHIQGYDRIQREGKTAWAEIHGEEGFDNFASRGFLESALPRLTFPSAHPSALELGCRTGPGACFLAEHGFHVDAVDLIPTAIDMAQQIAAERGLDIHFAVGDVCELPQEGKQYDLIVDSYCLQCIVFDAERQSVFSAVRARLKPDGFYLVSSAVLDHEHEGLIGNRTITDPQTGLLYTEYGSGLIDLNTSVVLQPFEGASEDFPDMLTIDGQSYLPHRRHLRPAALAAELEAAGFRIIERFESHRGSLICARQSA